MCKRASDNKRNREYVGCEKKRIINYEDFLKRLEENYVDTILRVYPEGEAIDNILAINSFLHGELSFKFQGLDWSEPW